MMNVLGYSDNHRSTSFSAAIRSSHAFCPTEVTLCTGPVLPRKKSSESPTIPSCCLIPTCQFGTVGTPGLTSESTKAGQPTLDGPILLQIERAFQLGPHKEGPYGIEELACQLTREEVYAPGPLSSRQYP